MKKGQKIVANCIVILMVVVFLVLPFWDTKNTKAYDIVFLGDSIIGNTGNYSIVQMVGEELGRSTFNGAFGGSSMSVDVNFGWGSVTSAQWCMVRLAKAIVYDDWLSQQVAMAYADSYRDISLQALPYFQERMDTLMQIDFNQVEILIIEHGTNDYNAGRTLDNAEDLYDITTFGGALRTSLKLLQEAYPKLQIILLSPIYCEFGEALELPCYSTDFGGGTLDEYVKLEQEIAKEFGVPYVDAYHGSGIWEENAKEYLSDGLHLNDEGVKRMSAFVTEELGQILQ